MGVQLFQRLQQNKKKISCFQLIKKSLVSCAKSFKK